jgi:hypothetical protein
VLETHELLDRFELLYSTNSKLSDLRRSYVDRDLSSIFRILPKIINGDIDDLRKAVTESNLHSIFRLANDEDLRKLILEDNTWKLWIVLNRYLDTQFIWAFKSSTQDILDINYNQHTYSVKRSDDTICELIDSPDTIINTSCEHIQDFSKWYNCIPNGKLVILQSNDYFEIDEHVNCSKSISQFSKSCPMRETLFEGELFLPKYTRFMKIGYKQ